MVNWFFENMATLLICAVLAIIVVGIVAHMVKNKKKGKTSCGCGCVSCPMSDACHQRK